MKSSVFPLLLHWFLLSYFLPQPFQLSPVHVMTMCGKGSTGSFLGSPKLTGEIVFNIIIVPVVFPKLTVSAIFLPFVPVCQVGRIKGVYFYIKRTKILNP